ncbi:MAG: UrcA family protein [Micropepsaceae bacterium]
MKKPMVACALAFLSFSFVANAEPVRLGVEGTAPYASVPYGDLNLSNPAGAKVMMQRITFAATRMCGGTPDIREIRERVMFKSCVHEAKNDAVHQLNTPLVTELFLEEKAKEDQLASAD